MPVSNLHPARNAVLPDGLVPVSDSERADLGEVISDPFTMGEGVRHSFGGSLAAMYGVDGRELDWWDGRAGHEEGGMCNGNCSSFGVGIVAVSPAVIGEFPPPAIVDVCIP